MTAAEMWNSPYEWSLAFVMLAAFSTTAALAYAHGYLRGMPTVFRIPIDTLTVIFGVALHAGFQPHTVGWSVALGCAIGGLSHRTVSPASLRGLADGTRQRLEDNDPDP